MVSVAESKVLVKNRTSWVCSDLSIDPIQMFKKPEKQLRHFENLNLEIAPIYLQSLNPHRRSLRS